MTLHNTDKQYYSDIIEMNKKLSESLQKRLDMYDELSKKNDTLVSKIETLNNGCRYLELENKDFNQKNQNLLSDNTLIFNENTKLRTDFQVYYNNYLSTNQENNKLSKENERINHEFNSIKDELSRIKTDHSNLIIKFKDILDSPNDTFYVKNEHIHRKKNCKYGTSCKLKSCIYRHVQLNDRQMTTAEFIKKKSKNNHNVNSILSISRSRQKPYDRYNEQQFKHKNNTTENYESRQRINLKRDRNNYDNYNTDNCQNLHDKRQRR
tara:strand:+ start:527 stop:1324 length:798 start_codon:yes stop_codon:yes gene_type:complete